MIDTTRFLSALEDGVNRGETIDREYMVRLVLEQVVETRVDTLTDERAHKAYLMLEAMLVGDPNFEALVDELMVFVCDGPGSSNQV